MGLLLIGYLLLAALLVLGPFSSCIYFAVSCGWQSVLQVASLERVEVSIHKFVHMILLLLHGCMYCVMLPYTSYRLQL